MIKASAVCQESVLQKSSSLQKLFMYIKFSRTVSTAALVTTKNHNKTMTTARHKKRTEPRPHVHLFLRHGCKGCVFSRGQCACVRMEEEDSFCGVE